MTDKRALRTSLRTARDDFGMQSVLVPAAFLARLSAPDTKARFAAFLSKKG